jgi:hypothetical protein
MIKISILGKQPLSQDLNARHAGAAPGIEANDIRPDGLVYLIAKGGDLGEKPD